MPSFGDTPVATASAPPGFELQRIIGRGASGRVFQAKQHSTSRLVALKMLDVDPASTDAGTRFDRECAVMGELGGHPNIVTVYDAGRHEGQPWIAMELCSAGSLADQLTRQGPMTVPESVAVLTKIAAALHTAHQRGVLHCDVKPANIMITEFGEPALGDFGIARLVGGRTRLSTIGGGFTLDHAPPEALKGDASTAAADVYSLGTTVWQLLEGRAPFSRASDSGVGAVITRILSEPLPPLSRTDLPDQLHVLLADMTAKDPASRPGDLSEVAERAAAIDAGGSAASGGERVGVTGALGVAGGVAAAEFATERGPGGASAVHVGLDELATERAGARAGAEYAGLDEMATGRLPSSAAAAPPTSHSDPPHPHQAAEPGPGDLHYVGWGGAPPAGGDPGLTRARVAGKRPPPGKPPGRSAGITGWFARPAVRVAAIALVVVALLAGAGVAVWWTTISSPQPTPAANQQGLGEVPGQPAAAQPAVSGSPNQAAPGQPPGAPNGGAPPAAPQADAAAPDAPPGGPSDPAGPAGTPASGTHTLVQKLGPNCNRPDYWRVSGPVEMTIAPDGAVSGSMTGRGTGSVQATCDGVTGTINWNIEYKITFAGRLNNGTLAANGTMTNTDRSTASGCTRDGQPVGCPPNIEAGTRDYAVSIVGRTDPSAGDGRGAVTANMARHTAGTWSVE